MPTTFPLLAMSALLVAGCATMTAEELARDRASREFGCPAEQVHTRFLSTTPGGNGIYKVAACGHMTTYVCNDTQESCEAEGQHTEPAE